jgi:hypothetical protein
MSNEKVAFLNYHTPALETGLYRAKQTSTVNGRGSFATDFQYFYVGSERYQLPLQQVFSVFPPNQSNGEHDNVMPHIELQRSTLPWERKASDTNDNISWLGLILLDETEINDPLKIKKETLLGIEYRNLINLAHEPGETQEGQTKETTDNENPAHKKLPVLWGNGDFLKSIMPRYTDLELLSHVRKGTDDLGQTFERAILVCNRMPKVGTQSTVYVVSLEGRFDGENFNFEKGKRTEDNFIPLLCLYSWRFSCPDTEYFKIDENELNRLEDTLNFELKNKLRGLANAQHVFKGKKSFFDALKESGTSLGDESDFKKNDRFAELCRHFRYESQTLKGLLLHLDTKDYGLPYNENDVPTDFKNFLDTGSIPIRHQLRNGGKTVSWYRSPFLPLECIQPVMTFNESADHTDELLVFNQETDMLDVSYSSAWELGRLMMVSNPVMSRKMQAWKMAQNQKEKYESQMKTDGYIPSQSVNFASDDGSDLSELLKKHFKQTALLQNIPFHYLVPEEALLPSESIRFFKIDTLWLNSLLQGMYSIGGKVEKTNPWKAEHTNLHGVLIRSDAVSGWPALIVEAYREAEGLERSALELAVGKKVDMTVKVDLILKERLGSNVLLCLFAKKIKTVQIYLPAESLHFGFTRPELPNEAFYKVLKDVNTGNSLLRGCPK